MLVKWVIVLTVIVSCLSLLFPKIIVPLISHIFGTNSNSDDSTASQRQHPHTQEMPQKGSQLPPNMHHDMRPGPYPGMRAAAEMQQSRQSQGSGRGMMGVVLPMYAVGIVVYLIYTLIKVFNKRKVPQVQTDGYGQSSDHPEHKPTSSNIFEDAESFEERKIEKLLTKTDEQHITEFEMEQLQKRLADTEQQMAQILEAMQTVHKKATTTDSNKPAARGNDNDRDSVKEEVTEKFSGNVKSSEVSTQGDRIAKSSDSSPDMDTYDIVDKGSNHSSETGFTPLLEKNLHPDIENITAAEIHTNKMEFGQDEEEIVESGTNEDETTNEMVVLEDFEANNADDTNLRKRKPQTNISD